jgi:Ca-activated chloride channel family protein
MRSALPASGLTILLAVLVAFTSQGTAAQSGRASQPQQPPGTVFRSGTGLIVSLFTTVNDAQKRLATDLTEGDFTVLDNDKPQPIVLFDATPRPLTIVVMLDTSGSMTNNLSLLRDAAEQFVIRLWPQDKAKVGAFNDKVQISSEFTNNRDRLVTELRNLDYGNGTRLWDAVGSSLAELHKIDGRKVVLVFTDGDDTASHIGLGDVIERARVDEVMVYAIGFESRYLDGDHMVTSKPDRGLPRIAEETGGGYFELTKSAELGPTFNRVAQELHSQYALGFEAKQLDGKLHKISIRMKQPGMTARARRTYVATLDSGR